MSQLDTPTVQKCGVADNDCIGAIATHCIEGRINLGTSVGIVNLDLQSHRASGGFYVRQLSFTLKSEIKRSRQKLTLITLFLYAPIKKWA